MSTRTTTRWLLALMAVALVGAACGSSDDDADDTASDTDSTVSDAPNADTDEPDDSPDVSDTAAADVADSDDMVEMSMTPGEGTTITMGRADWSTGYYQAELYRQLLTELGYEVTDPAEIELGLQTAYVAMAQGDFDFWANGWYPGHYSWLDAELTDGSLVRDHVSVIGEEMVAGGLQGMLIEKNFADEFNIRTLDDLDANPAAIEEFDKYDSLPGNGVADIFGCQESWTCDDILDSTIAFAGWQNIQQTIAGYDAMFAQAVNQSQSGEPFVIYTWTPSAYITQLIPGDNVYWVGIENPLDDSNPLGAEGGHEWDQRPGRAPISADLCPSALDDPDGLCQVGWVVADILVTANNTFLAANPAAAELLEQVKLSVIDVSLANVEQDEGADPAELATAWIADNRDLVDGWLDAARAAA